MSACLQIEAAVKRASIPASNAIEIKPNAAPQQSALFSWSACASVTPQNKRLILSADGKVATDKDYKCNSPYSGTIHPQRAELKQFQNHIDTCTNIHSIFLGIPHYQGIEQHEPIELITSKVEKTSPHLKAISRTKKNFKNTNISGFILFDIDKNDLKQDEVIANLHKIIPELDGVAMVVKPSSSSNIYDSNNNLLQGLKGLHIYVAVENLLDAERIKKLLIQRSWLVGLSHYEVSQAGSLLEYAYFDKSVLCESERLVYEARPELGAGLYQAENKSILIEGKSLDTSLIKALSTEKIQQVEAFKDSAKIALKPEVKRVLKPRKLKAIQKAKAEGKTAKQALKQFYTNSERKLLDKDLILYFADYGAVSVADVLKKPLQYHDAYLADPLEPCYQSSDNQPNTGKAKFYAYYSNKKFVKPVISSQAHGGTNVFYLNERDAKRTPLNPHFLPKKLLTPKQASKVLKKTVEAYIKKLPEETLIIKASAGSGKTTAAIDAIKNNKIDGQVHVFAPTHALCDEWAQKLAAAAPELKVIHRRGRGGTGPGDRFCKKYDLSEDVAESGQAVYSSLCMQTYKNGTEKVCEFYNQCHYIKQFDDSNQVIISPHSYLSLNHAGLEKHPSLVIIDESFFSQLIGTSNNALVSGIGDLELNGLGEHIIKGFKHHDGLLSGLKSAFKQNFLNNEYHSFLIESLELLINSNSNIEIDSFFKFNIKNSFQDDAIFIKHLEQAIESNQFNIEDNIKIILKPLSIANDFDTQIDNLVIPQQLLDIAESKLEDDISLINLDDISNHQLVEKIKNTLFALEMIKRGLPVFPTDKDHVVRDKLSKSRPFKDEFMLLKALLFELETFPDRKQSGLIHTTTFKDSTILNYSVSFKKKNNRINFYKEHKTPVLIIDADANKAIINRFFDNTKLVEINVKRNCSVTQIENSQFSKSGFLHKDKKRAKKEINKTVNLISNIAKNEKTLVVTYKAIIDDLKEHAPTNISFLHFGNLRGIDAYKDFKNVIIIGRNQTSAETVENQAAALFCDDEHLIERTGELLKEQRGRRMTGGCVSMQDVWVHADFRVQMILEQIRECESLQAVDRLRFIHSTDNDRNVYLVSNLVLDIDIDVLTNSKELESINPFDKIFQDDGVVVKSATVLNKNYDELFKNKPQIEYKLRIWEDVKMQLDTPYCRITSFKYRVKGAGGHDIEGFSRSDMSQQEIIKILIGLHGGNCEVIIIEFNAFDEQKINDELIPVASFDAYAEYEANYADYSDSYLGQFYKDIKQDEGACS